MELEEVWMWKSVGAYAHNCWAMSGSCPVSKALEYLLLDLLWKLKLKVVEGY